MYLTELQDTKLNIYVPPEKVRADSFDSYLLLGSDTLVGERLFKVPVSDHTRVRQPEKKHSHRFQGHMKNTTSSDMSGMVTLERLRDTLPPIMDNSDRDQDHCTILTSVSIADRSITCSMKRLRCVNSSLVIRNLTYDR